MRRVYCFLILMFLIIRSTGQVTSINCYNQNLRILPDTINLIQNGSFENGNCNPGNGWFCPNSGNYSCNIANWLCTGGGINTYARIVDSTFSYVPDNSYAVYFGNHYCEVCNPPTTLCPSDSQCVVLNVYPSHDINTGYGDSVGVRLEQQIHSLITGHMYLLEFWVGGEMLFPPFSIYPPGIFAVEIGDERFFLRCSQTEPDTGIGKRYVIEFLAIDSTETIRFTNWGHINSGNATELVLDDVRLIDASLVNEIEVKSNDGIKFFPNPINEATTINSNFIIHKFDIMNSIGKIVYSFIPNENHFTYRSTLSPGIYFCRLENINGNQSIIRICIY